MENETVQTAAGYVHRVAMYDMDRTITRSGTYSGFLMHVARQRQQWRLLLLPLVGLAGLGYALRLIDRSRNHSADPYTSYSGASFSVTKPPAFTRLSCRW